jgi:CBS-domain-containing membrane protein
MNIAFFLTPKVEVAFEKTSSTMRQALERMEHHGYSAIPILDDDGKYFGTLTQGDLLLKLKYMPTLSFKDTRNIKIKELEFNKKFKPVHINCNIEDLFTVAIEQNFVPVVDDFNSFIGIIKRSAIMNYCFERLFHQPIKEA